MASSKTLLLAIVLLVQPVAAAPLDLEESVAILGRADGATDHELLAEALDTIRRLGSKGAPAADTLASLLPHRARLYTDRDKNYVVRLRSYVVVTLADVGVPPAALPPLLEILANVDERLSPVEVGSAIRAAGSLGARGEPFVPYLTEALELDRWNAIEFSLERYEPLYPEEEATTVRLEAIRALGHICSAGDEHALEALRALASDPDPRVVAEAGRAVQLIGNRRIR